MPAKSRFNVGDRVRFADSFLARVQGHELAPLRGTVAAVIPAQPKPGCTVPARLKIRWDDSEGDPEGALERNISRA